MAVASMNTYTHMPISTQRYIIKTKSNLSKKEKSYWHLFCSICSKMCMWFWGGRLFFFNFCGLPQRRELFLALVLLVSFQCLLKILALSKWQINHDLDFQQLSFYKTNSRVFADKHLKTVNSETDQRSLDFNRVRVNDSSDLIIVILG